MAPIQRKYKSIAWILRSQIKRGANAAQWVWIRPTKENKREEFLCVYEVIPKGADCLYTPQQLLDQLDLLRVG